jgi:mono/diheme cytochrome c family protein
MNRALKRTGIGVLVLFALIQLWPVRRTNPPVSGDLAAPPEVASILRRSCYDCHSNETRWAWYSRIAPASWIVVHDVNEARKELNLSHWTEMPPKRQAIAPQKMLDKIDTGVMPLPRYLWLHPQARLSAEDIDTIRRWVESPH